MGTAKALSALGVGVEKREFRDADALGVFMFNGRQREGQGTPRWRWSASCPTPCAEKSRALGG